jgi:hypothetical protein
MSRTVTGRRSDLQPRRVAGPIAFAGYGIDATPIGYNDFDGIDLKGKVALILRYEPQEKDDTSNER